MAADAPADGGLQEVTVTAQRRTENLQTVPLSVTAFTADALRQQGIVNVKDISERTPGLTMGQFNPGQPQIYIRGLGTNARGAGEDPGVIVFVDEVYIGRAQGSDIDLFDLDRAEVLRGPQGTLFGRNVIGGAISLITTKPGPEPKWGLEGSFGDFKSVSGRGFVSGELVNNVYGKVAFSGKRRDTYLINHIGSFPLNAGAARPFAQNTLQGDSSQSIRAQLRYQPRDGLDVNLTVHASSQDADGQVRHFGAGPAGGVLYTSDSILIPGYADDYRNVLVDDPGQYRSQASGANLRFDVDVGDSMVFTSLSAYRYATATEIEPGIGTPALSALRLNSTTPAQVAFTVDGGNDYFDRDKMLTQEFRLASKGDSRLDWVAGLYYLDQDIYRDETATIALKTRGVAGAIVGTNTFGDEIQLSANKSYAIFGQASYAITDRWSATVGARYTKDKKDFRGIGDPGGLTINEAYDVRRSKSWTATTPKGSIEFKPTPSSMIYVSAAKGYKAGGYPNLGPTAVVAGTAYDPESALQYEDRREDRVVRPSVAGQRVGVRHRLRRPAGAAAADSGRLSGRHSGRAVHTECRGFQVEGRRAGVQHRADGPLADQRLLCHARCQVHVVLRSGRLPAARRRRRHREQWQVAAQRAEDGREPAGSLHASPCQRWPLSFQADTRYKDKVYGDPANQEFAATPSYTLTNLRAAYTTPAGNIEIAAALNNASDEKYLLHNFPSLGMGFQFAGPPRMALLSVSIRN